MARNPCSSKAGRATCISLTVILVVLGILLFAGSWIVRYELGEYTRKAIIDTIVVDSPKSSGYDGWQKNYGADRGSSNLHQYFYFCNITNVHDVINNNALPIIQEVGPYYYWQKRDNIDVAFLEGGNKVSYNTWTRFDFLSEQSNGTENDIIYSVNPAYLGALALAGGEVNLLVGATGPSIKLFFDFMWSTFVPDFMLYSVPDILSDAVLTVRARTGLSMPGFLDAWANRTAPAGASTLKTTALSDDPIWAGLLVSANSSSGPSMISADAASALFDPNRQSSLLNMSWSGAQLWGRATRGEATSRVELADTFGLTAHQVDMVCTWLSVSFYEQYTLPNITTLWGVESISDLAYLQWGMGLLSQTPVPALYPDNATKNVTAVAFPATPELALYWRSLDKFGSLSFETSKKLLAGPYGVFEASNVAGLVAALEQAALPPFDDTLLYQRWGLTIDDATTFGTYFGYLTSKYTSRLLDDILYNQGGGLIAARTVSEWLWESQDPLLRLVAPSLASKAVIVGNETTPAAARERHKSSKSWTGKKDIGNIGVYLEWQGQTVLHGVYAKDLPVSGVNNMGQFAPFRDLKTDLYTWDNYYQRPITLEPKEMIKMKGVDMIRYLVSDSTWAVNSTLYNFIPGFANMTGANYGATVFLSNPHMQGANESWAELISGFPKADPKKDVTVIDIEPNSGTIVHYDEGLEINVYLDPESRDYALYYPNVRRGVMVPVVWTREFGTISDKDAKAVRDTLYFAFNLQTTLFWALLAVGAVLIVLSLLPMFFLLRMYFTQRRSNLYTYRAVNVNDDSDDLLRTSS